MYLGLAFLRLYFLPQRGHFSFASSAESRLPEPASGVCTSAKLEVRFGEANFDANFMPQERTRVRDDRHVSADSWREILFSH